jgi:hypothetical protein
MKVSTGSSHACTVNPFTFIPVLIFGCLLSEFCGIFFIEKVNLLLGVFVLEIPWRFYHFWPGPATRRSLVAGF